MGVLPGRWDAIALKERTRPAAANVLSVPEREVPAAVRRRRLFETIRSHAILIFVSALFFVPLIFVILTSLMTDQQANTKQLLPSPFVPGNYADVFSAVPFLRYTFNTMTVAFLSTIGVVLSSIPVAYALSRMQWRGRQVVFVLVLATLMIPREVTIVPTFILFSQMQLVNTLWPLILPAWFGYPFFIFLLRQFFMSIPREMDEAAMIDGANPFRTLVSVILPQAWPAVIAVAIFTFVYSWNNYFEPLIYLSTKPDLVPISVGLSRFNEIHYTNPALIQAGTLMTLVIPVLLFIAFQRFFTRGIVITGVEK